MMNIIVSLLPNLWQGTLFTLSYFAITAFCSLPLSFLVVMCRLSNITFLRQIVQFYTYLMQGTPLMLQLIFIYFGLPYLGITLTREVAAIVAFILNYTAYFTEILRGGIQSLDIGQAEAGKVLGLSKWYRYRRIILPQVIKRSLPAFGNEFLALLKDTALISVLGLSDVLKVGKGAANTYASVVPFVLVAIVYLAMSAIISYLLKRGEKRYSYYA